MPEIKINKWLGIYQNIDENNLNFDYIKDGSNFLNKETYTEYIPRNIINYTLPNISLAFPGRTWSWETGKFCFIYDDIFYNNDPETPAPPINPLKKCLILVAKTYDSINLKYHRLVYLQDLSNGTWYELSKNGTNQGGLILIENHDGANNFDNSLFSTSIDGQVIINNNNGVIKLYFPHDTFIINYYRRRLYYYGSTKSPNVTGWYIDRIVEQFDRINTSLLYYSDNQWVPIYYNPAAKFNSNFYCNSLRRIQYKLDYTILSNQNQIVGEVTLTKTDNGEVTNIKVPTVGAGYVVCKARKYTFTYNSITVSQQMIPGFYPYWPSASYINNNNVTLDSFYFPISAAGTYYLLPIPFIETIGISGSDWLSLSNANPGDAGWDWDGAFIQRADGGTHLLTWPVYYITPALFNSLTLIWTKEGKISDIGFENKYAKIFNIITGVINEQDEVIIDYSEIPIALDTTTYPKFAIEYKNPTIPYNHNRNLTRIRIYLGLQGRNKLDTVEPEMIKEYNLLDPVNDITKFFVATTKSWSGFTLANNIGISFDTEYPDKHQLITGLRAVTTDSNITLALQNNNYANIYYSAVGGGNLQSNVIYKQNVIPFDIPDTILGIASINNKFIAVGKEGLRIINIVNPETGALQFTYHKTLPFTINNSKDIINTTSGIVIHTKQGIYITNGYEHQLISEPINNVVKTYYSTAKIFYSSQRQELYYLVPSLSKIYFYSFEYKTWNSIDKYQELP